MDPILQQFQASMLASRGVEMPSGRRIELGLGPSSHTNRPLTNIAVSYANRDFIADAALPIVPVAKRSDTYYRFKPETMLSVAQTNLSGNEGMPGRVAYALDTAGSYGVVDHGLMDFVSADDEANADDPLEPMVTSTEITTNFLLLAREVRVAAAVFGAGNYGANTAALAGADRWDVSTSDPVAKILTAIRTPLVRPDTLVIGEEAWDFLRTHPKVLQYVLSRAATTAGVTPLTVTEDNLAALFGLRKVLVGRALYNSAVEGQALTAARVWGKSCAIIKAQDRPNRRRTDTFGYTFRFGSMETRTVFNELPGRAGGTYVKVSHADAEEIVAGSNAGFLYTTVVS